MDIFQTLKTSITYIKILNPYVRAVSIAVSTTVSVRGLGLFEDDLSLSVLSRTFRRANSGRECVIVGFVLGWQWPIIYHLWMVDAAALRGPPPRSRATADSTILDDENKYYENCKTLNWTSTHKRISRGNQILSNNLFVKVSGLWDW